MTNTTQAAGIPAYQIQRTYLAPDARLRVNVQGDGEFILNAGVGAVHLSYAQLHKLIREAGDALLAHDMLFGTGDPS